jgi:hypothetical protein
LSDLDVVVRARGEHGAEEGDGEEGKMHGWRKAEGGGRVEG